MHVSRHGFAPKRRIRCQEIFGEKTSFIFAVRIEQLRGLVRCKNARSAPLRLPAHGLCDSHQRHGFRAKAKDR